MSNEHESHFPLDSEAAAEQVEPVELDAAKPRRRGSKTSLQGLTAATVQRILDDAREIEQADKGDRELAALLLGVEDNPAKLIAAGSTKGKELDVIAGDVVKIAEAPAHTRGIDVMELDRAQLKPVWEVLENLKVVKGKLPTTTAAAARALAEAKIDAGKVQGSLTRAKSLVSGS